MQLSTHFVVPGHKFKFLAEFPIGLHVVLQQQIENSKLPNI